MSPILEILEIEGVRGLLSLGPKIYENFGDRSPFPYFGAFGEFWTYFDFFGSPDRLAARAHVSEQNFAPFSFHKPRFGHMLQQVHLFILLCLLARSTLSHHTSQSYALTRCCRTVCTLLWPMLTVRNAVTTQHLEKSTFKSAHEPLKM